MKYGLLRLLFHRPKIREQLLVHKRYIEKMEGILKLEIEELERIHKESPPDAFDEETNEFITFPDKECYELRNVFTTIQTKSEIITVYSLLEYEMNKICDIFEDCIDHPVKIKDLKGNGILDVSKRYLEKVVVASFPVNGKFWEEIQRIQEIRNLLVHADGVVKTGNNLLMKYIKNSDYLDIYSDGKLYVKSGYTLHITNIIIGFFDELFLSLEDTNITRSKTVA